MRDLGGYERLLGRRSPGTDALSLSHAAAFLLTGAVDDAAVVAAAAAAMARHPMLRAGIRRDATTGREAWVLCDRPVQALAREVVRTSDGVADLDTAWQREFNAALNGPAFPADGPQWRLLNLAGAGGGVGAWVFCVNHAADDQQSLNIVVTEMLAHIARGNVGDSNTGSPMPFPASIEDAVAPGGPGLKTAQWSLYQLQNSAAGAAVLPARIVRLRQADPDTYTAAYVDPDARSTYCEFLRLTAGETEALRLACRAKGVTITNAASAAVLAVTAAAFQTAAANDGAGAFAPPDARAVRAQRLRFLLSVGLRPFGAGGGDGGSKKDFTGGTVACASGAVDFVLSVPAGVAADGATALAAPGDTAGAPVVGEEFWALAGECRARGANVIERMDLVPEVRFLLSPASFSLPFTSRGAFTVHTKMLFPTLLVGAIVRARHAVRRHPLRRGGRGAQPGHPGARLHLRCLQRRGVYPGRCR